jgi:hypothetical protein
MPLINSKEPVEQESLVRMNGGLKKLASKKKPQGFSSYQDAPTGEFSMHGKAGGQIDWMPV